MPIKTSVDGNIQLVNFIPFQLPPNTVLVENIEQMFSYDLQIPTQPFEIDYLIGTDEIFSFQLSIKNLTQNATLTTEVQYDESFFITSTKTITINPEEIKTINLTLNTEYLDTVKTTTTKFQEIKVLVTNVQSNGVVYKNINTTNLSPTFLPTS